MKKIILSIFIVFTFVNSYSLYSMDVNNNNTNNNNNNNNFCLPELPYETWIEIGENLIKNIQKSKTSIELKSAIKEFLDFSLISKKHNIIAKVMIAKLIKGNKIILEYYIERIFAINGIIFTSSKDTESWINKWGSWITIVNHAIHYNIKEIVELFIKSGENINTRDVNDKTALMIAAEYNNKEIAELLIQNDADINIQNFYGRTSLMYAAQYNSKKIAKLLIKYGADVSIQDTTFKTALMIAVEYNNKEIAKLIEEKNQNNQNKNNEYYNKKHKCIVQ